VEANQKTKLKILFLAKWYLNRYDPQLAVYIRKHALAAAKHCDVALLHVFSDEQMRDKKQEVITTKEGNFTTVTVYFKSNRSGFFVFDKIINFIRYRRAVIKGLQFVRNNFGDHDITHAYILLRPAIVAYLIKTSRNKPFVISEQWSGFATGKYAEQTGLEKFLTRFVVKRAKAVLPVSEFLKEHMLKNGLKGNYTVIPNIIELPSIKAISRNDSKIKILTVADLVDEIKNVSGTLRALNEIIPSNPDIEFHIIGEGKDRQKLETLASEMNLLNKNVFFHGIKSNEEVYEMLSAIDFLIMNSNFETFSLICAESISCGKPVVATRCGGPQEFVTEKTGILVEPGNHHELVSAIQKMVKEYRNYSAEDLRKEVEIKFSFDVVARKLVGIYKSILNVQ
jgi:glycosyltransferase involved in cell wall biosynthesis